MDGKILGLIPANQIDFKLSKLDIQDQKAG